LGALAAGVSAAVDLSQQKSDEAAEASGLLASVEEQKAGLESALGEKEQAIAELNAQIEALNAQTADVQAQLAAALAVTAGLEQQAGEREGLLGDLQGQIQDAVSRLQEIVPAEDLPQPEIAEVVEGEAAEGEAVEGEAAEGEAVEGEITEGEGAAGAARPVGLPALVTGVAALVNRNSSSLADLQAQLDGLSQEKAALEAALEEKTGQLAGYNDYALSLQGQVNELASQVTSAEAALALKEQAEAETQAQIEALTAQIEALNTQVADLQTQLDAALGAKAELEQTLQATQAQLDAAQADLAQIDEESQRALGDKAVRLGAVGAGAAAVAAIRDKEEALTAANEQVAALQKQIDDLLAERDSVVLSKGELESTLQGREADLAYLRSQLEALEGQMTGVVEERVALEEQLAQMEETMTQVEAQRSSGLSFEAAAEFSDALARLPAIKSHAASAAIVAGVQPTLSPRIQALTDVKGIGSVYQQRLYRAGVGTYWELASLPDDDMAETLQIPDLQRPRMDFEETRGDAYELAKQTGTVGLLWDGDHVDDFEVLPSIGKTFEKRLYEAGITTYEQLMDADVERLAEIIQPPPMREVNYDELKERARQILAERLAQQPVE
jgi:chromosome segregation ATPase